MPACHRFCPYEHQPDRLEAWCRRHGFDAVAQFDGGGRVPEIWRDEQRAWWFIPLPGGGDVTLLVDTDTVAIG